MKINEPPYRLVQMDSHIWRFVESPEMEQATLRFDRIQEGIQNQAFVTALRRFLRDFPNHIDALHHYSTCWYYRRKTLEALAFSQTAVATGIRAFPKEFEVGVDQLDTGYISNRPFLRAMHGLMLAQWDVGLNEEAISTAEMCLGFDEGDRMGARLSLPIYLIELDRIRCALNVFQRPAFKNSFWGVEYLHAFALICLHHQESAIPILKKCLHRFPQVARYILNPILPQPPNESPGGIIVGSEYEGWMHARDFGALWRKQPVAMQLLQKEAHWYAQNDWKSPPMNIQDLVLPQEGKE